MASGEKVARRARDRLPLHIYAFGSRTQLQVEQIMVLALSGGKFSPSKSSARILCRYWRYCQSVCVGTIMNKKNHGDNRDNFFSCRSPLNVGCLWSSSICTQSSEPEAGVLLFFWSKLILAEGTADFGYSHPFCRLTSNELTAKAAFLVWFLSIIWDKKTRKLSLSQLDMWVWGGGPRLSSGVRTIAFYMVMSAASLRLLEDVAVQVQPEHMSFFSEQTHASCCRNRYVSHVSQCTCRLVSETDLPVISRPTSPEFPSIVQWPERQHFPRFLCHNVRRKEIEHRTLLCHRTLQGAAERPVHVHHFLHLLYHSRQIFGAAKA